MITFSLCIIYFLLMLAFPNLGIWNMFKNICFYDQKANYSNYVINHVLLCYELIFKLNNIA